MTAYGSVWSFSGRFWFWLKVNGVQPCGQILLSRCVQAQFELFQYCFLSRANAALATMANNELMLWAVTVPGVFNKHAVAVIGAGFHRQMVLSTAAAMASAVTRSTAPPDTAKAADIAR